MSSHPDRRHYYVYIMASERQTLYTGITNDLRRRVDEHERRLVAGFTARYGCTRLVYYEATPDVRAAIEREKQIKGWVRRKKVALIRSMNPGFDDLSVVWLPSTEVEVAT